MHGKSGTMLILNLSPMTEEDEERERLRHAARHSIEIVSGEEDTADHSCPGMGESSRSPDDVLFDFMDDTSESMFFAKSEMPRFARAMGANDDQIRQFQMQLDQESGNSFLKPESLAQFQQDYADYRKFGGDTVAMELARDTQSDQMSDEYMDGMLGMSMDSGSMGGMKDPKSAGMSAIQEQFGIDARAVLQDETDGVVTFMVDTPETGPMKYVYDSRDGVGRTMRGE